MLTWSFILGPVVGGIIGGFTNKVAIKMLFRPYNRVMIGKVHVPFTPGIIPKEKGNIAREIGKAVSLQLLNGEVLGKTLLSDEMLGKIDQSLDRLIYNLLNDRRSVRQWAEQYLSHEELSQLVSQTEGDLTKMICVKLSDEAIGDTVANMAIDHALSQLRSEGFFARLGATILASMRENATDLLARNINGMLHDNSADIVEDLIQKEGERLLALPVCRLFEGKEAQLAKRKETVKNIYRKVVSENLPKVLSAIDLKKVIEDRINDMDMAETEKTILDVVDKQLKALVWFGVLLGFLLGFLTNII